MESTKSWQAMTRALANGPPDHGRVLRLEETGPASKAAITEYVEATIEQHATPKAGRNLKDLADLITTAVLNKLGAGYTRPPEER